MAIVPGLAALCGGLIAGLYSWDLSENVQLLSDDLCDEICE